MPLSKEECIKKAKEFRDKSNQVKPGAFNVTDEEIARNVERKYENYVEAANIFSDFENRRRLCKEIAEEKHWYTGNTRGAADFLVDPTKTKEENVETLKNYFSADENKTNENMMMYITKLFKEMNLKEMSEASLNMRDSLDFMKKNPAIGFFSYTFYAIARNVSGVSRNYVGNVELVNKACEDFAGPIEGGSRCKELVGFQSTPLSFLFEEDIPSMDQKLSTDLFTHFDEFYKKNPSLPTDGLDFGFDMLSSAFGNLGKENFQRSYDYIHNNNIESLMDVTLDKNNQVVKRSNAEKEKLNNIKPFRDMEPGDCAKCQEEIFDNAKGLFNPVKNKKTTKNELLSFASKLKRLSETHFNRKKPPLWERFFRTKYARGYANERKVMDKYCKVLKDSGVSQETINMLTDRKGPTIPNDLKKEVENVNKLVDQRINLNREKEEANNKNQKTNNINNEEKEQLKETSTNKNPVNRKQIIVDSLKDDYKQGFDNDKTKEEMSRGITNNIVNEEIQQKK